MKNRNIAIVLILVLSLTVGWVIYQVYTNRTNPISAVETLSKENDRSGQSNYQLSKYIGFNAEQQQQFHSMEDDYRQKLSQLKNEISKVEMEIMVELKEKHPNRELLKELSNEVGNTHTAIKETTIEHFLAIKSICTPEQEEKISTLFSRLENRSKMGRGEGGKGKGMGKKRRGGRHNQNNRLN